jgi:type III secretion protein D
MKLLRILTGIHAGAQLQLDSLALHIGPEEEADIRIIDWDAPSMMLTFNDQASVQLEPLRSYTAPETEKNAEGLIATLTDFIPAQFGNIVICIGDTHAIWPSDSTLLEKLQGLAPSTISMASSEASTTDLPTTASRWKKWWVMLGIALTILSIGSAVVLNRLHAKQLAQEARIETLVQRLKQTISQNKIHGLQVNTNDEAVVIEGIVATSEEEAKARQIIDQLGSAKPYFNMHPIIYRYDVASKIAQDITMSLKLPNVEVNYMGAGVFQAKGAVPDIQQANEALNHLKSDFSHNVRRIDSLLTQARPDHSKIPYSGLMSSQGARYYQTPDGVKHLYPAEENTASPNDVRDF